MKLTTKKSKKLTLNLTSLIDVLFILIIFFAVSSTFLEQPGIELKLPEAESSESFTTQKIILYIDKDNNLFLNDQLISENTMISEINNLGKLTEEGSIVLKADKEVDHGEIIKIMDMLRKNKLYKLVISTNIPE
ncbi:MAG: biopolymer transporter ExbD [Calditrichaeota bacterium]|nr:MAG: biopolymer transporter ExbD [Calditrichota bacterium]MBL1205506.1 biopolymer transporter ExbD [Calditrichota bacterium]NOG45334.1 biopolymer transporter ExbD [Calditrichota bacterium]